MAETRIAGTTEARKGRYERGKAIADRRRGYSYINRPAHVGGSVYMVPSCTTEGVRYRVDVAAGTCECEDHRRGHTCKHLYCGMILSRRRRGTLAKVAS